MCGGVAALLCLRSTCTGLRSQRQEAGASMKGRDIHALGHLSADLGKPGHV